MKLARFRQDAGPARVGRVDGDVIVDVTELVGDSVRAVLPSLPERAAEIAAFEGDAIALSDVELLAPIDAPQKYLAIGMNYAEHTKEAAADGIPTPKNQFWFNKQVSCINAPSGDVVRPEVSDKLDYEAELGVVIGRECKHVSRDDAASVIGGYLVTNDFSVRDWLQKRSPTFTLGKSFDTHGPIGPWLTTADEVEDPHNLRIRLTVNGEERQNGLTDDMIYDIYDQIAELTTVMTLYPGDIIATGTPSGIGAPKGVFLQPGDVVETSIEGLGSLRNVVVAEDSA
ncbi:fumarylacetoacetate hydrolase family protein [Gulosibacter molinativorax]|uniref:FAA hydrolase family protein n=1 Tax=Gulosibacter molinativorax TaxID=256821 RepID=A0ABT7C9Q8_9MICO|nr:fumarylacetoacetate hydrolase family protein [Gulosibacter molinativorax]MDJ1371949.1 FAA hydrolase family protein [Gulosibacter molinativorax]QUY62687.1 Fumarylacetoacetate hydrolase domain-containing protein 2 [Gulosibacter molinativorax]